MKKVMILTCCFTALTSMAQVQNQDEVRAFNRCVADTFIGILKVSNVKLYVEQLKADTLATAEARNDVSELLEKSNVLAKDIAKIATTVCQK